MTAQKWLVLPDLHVPEHDPRALDAVLDYAADNGPWTGVLQLGDYLDLSILSRFNAENLRAVENGRLEKDFIMARTVFDQIYQAAAPERFVILEGNHDYRLEVFMDKHPQLSGLLDFKRNIVPGGYDAEIVRYWSRGEHFRIGKALFIHGLYTGENHPKKHLNAYAENVFYGHLHDTAMTPITTIGDNKTRVAASLGCLCKYNPYWMKGYPNKWQQAFATFHFRPDGFFNWYLTSIFNGRFTGPDGREYGRKKGRGQ